MCRAGPRLESVRVVCSELFGTGKSHSGPIWVWLAHKWDKSGTLSDQISVQFGSLSKMSWMTIHLHTTCIYWVDMDVTTFLATSYYYYYYSQHITFYIHTEYCVDVEFTSFISSRVLEISHNFELWCEYISLTCDLMYLSFHILSNPSDWFVVFWLQN